VTGIAIWHIVDGKVVERWENRDTPGLFQQIGATITPPEVSQPVLSWCSSQGRRGNRWRDAAEFLVVA
jgi:hypothetical protein